MNFVELNIQTFRNAPSDARGIGVELLYRAGYLDREFKLTNLGCLTNDRILKFHENLPIGEIDDLGGLRVIGHPDCVYHLLSENGKIDLLYCPNCYFGGHPSEIPVNRSPAFIEAALPVEKIFTPNCGTINELAVFLNIPEQRTAKALLFTRLSDNKVIFVVVRGDQQVSMEKLEQHVGELRLATPEEILSIGAVPGYASPIGTHDAFIAVDQLIASSPNLAAGANEKDQHLINTNYGRDYEAFLISDLVTAEPGDACPSCGKELIYHTAYLYSGAGDPNLLTAIAEHLHDERGLTLAMTCAPADIYLMNIPGKELDTTAVLPEIQEFLTSAGYTVLVDDRLERAGVKFNDADLIGLPVRIAVGERGLRENAVEVKARVGTDVVLVPISELPNYFRTNFPKGN